jgi:VWFA-related protein
MRATKISVFLVVIFWFSTVISPIRATARESGETAMIAPQSPPAQHRRGAQGQQRSEVQERQKSEAQEPVLKLKAELVNVRAVVTDKNGKVVDGLKKEDFEVLENNRPQEISFFSLERIISPATAAGGMTPADPGKAKGAAALSRSNASRSIILYVDTMNLSHFSLPLVKAELKKFLATQMREQDWIALVTTNNSAGMLEQFTQDKQVLHRAIDKLRPWQPETGKPFFTPYLAGRVLSRDPAARLTALCIVRMEAGEGCNFQDANPVGVQLSAADESRVNARARDVLLQANQRRQITLSTLKAVTESLQDMPGQKILALFSDGFTMFDSFGQIDMTSLQTVTGRALRSGVVIYSFDSRGLRQDNAFIDASTNSFFPPPQFAGFMSASNSDAESSLNALAADTGGKALFNTNNLNLGLQKALDENSLYYALDYYSSNDANDGKFRKLTVRVKNHPDYTVRTQKGYAAPDAKTAEQPLTAQQRLIRAMTAPLPATALGVAAISEYIEKESDNAQVTLSIYTDPNTFDYVQQNNLQAFDVELGVAVLDESGKLVKTFNEQIKGSLSTEQLKVAKRNGYRYSKRIELKPGTYNVRVGLMETRTGKIGTTLNWVEVPDLSKGKLQLSDLLLLNTAPQEAGKAATGQAISKQGIRIFKSVDILSYAFRIHNSADETNLTMQVAFIQNGATILQTDWLPVASLMDNKDSKGINVSQQFKLNNLKPGTYELKLKVKDGRSNQTAQREASFTIEP